MQILKYRITLDLSFSKTLNKFNVKKNLTHKVKKLLIEMQHWSLGIAVKISFNM